MDGPPAQSLGVEPLDRDVMKKPPRYCLFVNERLTTADVNLHLLSKSSEPVFNNQLLTTIVLTAFVMVVGTLGTFYFELVHEVCYALISSRSSVLIGYIVIRDTKERLLTRSTNERLHCRSLPLYFSR